MCILNKIAIVSENIDETFAYDHLNQIFFPCFRPGSLIVGIKVGVRDSQVKQMIVGAKQLLKNFTKFDSSFFAVKDPKGTI